MIRVVAKGKLKQGVKLEEYLTLARELVTETNKEEGCISYALHEDINDPTIVTMIEKWVDEEAIEQHNCSEHVRKIVPELRKLRESTEINLYREIK
ncbi:putative quinol monooxygenase [Neobacillus drentensis]|uniref:putative quinol monooxygenase n=1 Tax=Neobacillus drentensis TaxID=220684 RepID=UPI00286350A0|nr:putative quinol monooxygenase [Neobacillus drentensis]MDR7238442.1 quinol monooxygenase YgiN [Neobacillus drentensis]